MTDRDVGTDDFGEEGPEREEGATEASQIDAEIHDIAEAIIGIATKGARQSQWVDRVPVEMTLKQVTRLAALIADSTGRGVSALVKQFKKDRRQKGIRIPLEPAAEMSEGDDLAALDRMNDGARGRGGDLPAHIPTPAGFVFDRINQEFIDLETGAGLAASSVNGMIHPRLWRVMADEEGEEARVLPTADMMLDTRTMAAGRTWWPGQPRFIEGKQSTKHGISDAPGLRVFNEYRARGPVPDSWAGDASLFEAHMEFLIPDPFERNLLLDVMAHNVQHPGVKVNGIWIIHGPQGAGKDTAFKPLAYWLGTEAYRYVKGSKAAARFNTWVRSIVAVINETSSGTANAIQLYEEIKDTAVSPPDWISVEYKGENEFMIWNCVTIYLLTNHPFSLHTEEDDRRLTLIESVKEEAKEAKLKADPSYFERLHAWLDGGGWKTVIHMLSKRDISNFKPKADARMTPSKRALQSHNRGARRTVIDDVIDDYIASLQPQLASPEELGKDWIKPEAIIAANLVQFAEDNKVAKGYPTNITTKINRGGHFVHAMREHGYVRGLDPDGSGHDNRVWVPGKPGEEDKGEYVSGIYVLDSVAEEDRDAVARLAAAIFLGRVLDIDEKRKRRLNGKPLF